VGERSAAKLSARGLTINGKGYVGAPHVEPAKTFEAADAAQSAAASAAGK
jgi:hypothetical protein